MDFNKLTIKSQEAVAAAQERARRLGHPELYPEHLLLALLDQELPRTLAERAGASADALRAEAEATLRAKPAPRSGRRSSAPSRRWPRWATSSSLSSTCCSRSTSCRVTRCSRHCRRSV